nr:protein fam136a [Hymenolepis microstoma]
MDPIALENEAKKLQNKYSDAISGAIKDWDTNFLRNMQSIYFGCGKKCCDNKDYSTEQVQSCIERCEQPVSSAQNLVQSELTTLQNRFQSCVRQCSHQAYDKFKGTEEELSEAQRMLVQKDTLVCVNNCVEEQISTAIPAAIRAVSASLKKISAGQSS